MSDFFKQAAGWLWGAPLLIVLLGGGLFFTFYSGFTPFLYLRHGVDVLLGRYDSEKAPGEVSHFRALCSALSGTVGMGNVAGVAIAITQGGPGALFWMWLCALVGMATKFFTCSLALDACLYCNPTSLFKSSGECSLSHAAGSWGLKQQ
jgi:AGCS family alanine or glycine:cation symporter